MVCSRNSSCELRQNDIKHAYDQIKMFDTIDKSLNDSNNLLDDYNDILSSNAKKKSSLDTEEKMRYNILARMAHYNEQIIHANNKWGNTFKNIYFYLLIAFIVVILVKRDRNISNFFFVVSVMIAPMLLALIFNKVYHVQSNIISFI